MLLAVDTNVLAYAEGAGDEKRRHMAAELMARLPAAAVILPVQVLGELYRVLVGKLRQPAARAMTIRPEVAMSSRCTTRASG